MANLSPAIGRTPKGPFDESCRGVAVDEQDRVKLSRRAAMEEAETVAAD